MVMSSMRFFCCVGPFCLFGFVASYTSRLEMDEAGYLEMPINIDKNKNNIKKSNKSLFPQTKVQVIRDIVKTQKNCVTVITLL